MKRCTQQEISTNSNLFRTMFDAPAAHGLAWNEKQKESLSPDCLRYVRGPEIRKNDTELHETVRIAPGHFLLVVSENSWRRFT
jgi:hypothetical protein